MIVTHALEMDLSRRGITPRIDVVQDDKYSRDLAISLYSLGKPWAPGQDADAVIRYAKSDGTGGVYNLLPDGTPAWRIEGNLVTIALAPQVCTAAGQVDLVVSLKTEKAQLSSFLIELNVQRNPVFQAVSEDYINDSSWLPADGWEPGKFLGTDAEGCVVAMDLPELDGDVQTVNGIHPDAGGNIDLPCRGVPKPAAAASGQFLRVKSTDENGIVTALEAVHLNANVVTSCMYNDHEAPVIPEEIAIFPYRFIMAIDGTNISTTYYLYGIDEAPVTWIDDSLYSPMCFGTGGRTVSGRWAIWNPGHPAWVLSDAAAVSVRIRLNTPLFQAPGLIWSNVDAFDMDGGLILAATDPVPIFEEGSAPAPGGSQLPHITLDSPVNTTEETVLTPADCEKLRSAAAQGVPVLITFQLDAFDTVSTVHIMMDHLVVQGDHIFTRDFRLIFLDNRMYIAVIYPNGEAWSFGVMDTSVLD